jgi:hypothetical protein
MTIGNTDHDSVQRALLCICDADVDAALKTPLFGQPLLFHLTKNLQAAGLQNIAFAVETVPPELPLLIDRLQHDGLDIALLRNGPEAAEFCAQPGTMLLQTGAVWISPYYLGRMLEKRPPYIVTLPEEPRFTDFERIDLNRRWAGVALVDGALARQAGKLVEGWRIDSWLLRAALQQGYADRPLAAAEAADIVLHAGNKGGTPQLVRQIAPATHRHAVVEQLNFSIADIAIRRFSGQQWWAILLQIAPLVLALAALATAGFVQIIPAWWIGAAALFARDVRTRARQVEYIATKWDSIDIATLAALCAALFLNLQWLIPGSDAAFLMLALSGLLILAQEKDGDGWAKQFAPFLCAVWLAVLAAAGLPVVAVQIAIAAMILTMVAQHFAGRVKGKLTA